MPPALRWGHFPSKFRFRFSHASASRAATSNIIVEVQGRDGISGYGEGCPRSYVTGETEETSRAFVAKYGPDLVESCADLSAIWNWIEVHEAQISQNPAAFAALETALLDMLARREGRSIEEYLGYPPLHAPMRYSAVLGDSGPGKTSMAAFAYSIVGLSDFKIKMNADIERDKRKLARLPRQAKIRVDANNLWQEPELCIVHISTIGRKIWAIEEPLAVGDVSGMQKISQALDAAIILDESLINISQLSQYSGQLGSWVANIRVSKCGGLLRSIELAHAAQAQGMGVILGAHVGETSLLTRAAMTVGHALGKGPLAREGAFGKILLKQDISESSLTFGRSGILNPDRYLLARNSGLGLDIVSGRVDWKA
jgi:L-alanine-DL-glutamate epimerase-like enolase superfamily enzyme